MISVKHLYKRQLGKFLNRFWPWYMVYNLWGQVSSSSISCHFICCWIQTPLFFPGPFAYNMSWRLLMLLGFDPTVYILIVGIFNWLKVAFPLKVSRAIVIIHIQLKWLLTGKEIKDRKGNKSIPTLATASHIVPVTKECIRDRPFSSICQRQEFVTVPLNVANPTCDQEDYCRFFSLRK